MSLKTLALIPALLALGAQQAPAPAQQSASEGKSKNPSASTTVAPRQVRIGGEMMAAKLTYHPTPEYPESAKRSGLEGMVKLKAIISKEGSVRNLTTISGEAILVDAARQAVSKWRYRPTTLEGKPIEVLTEIDVNFQLSGVNILHSSDIAAPVATYHPDPPYTDKARKARQEGTVVLSIGIDAHGKVVDVEEVSKKLGDGLDKSAVQTVRTWKFKPAIKDGAAVPVHVAVDLTFHLPPDANEIQKPH